MSKKKAKRHHTVPQFLLRQFASGGKRKRIWVYDKQTRRAYETSLGNACVRGKFYELRLGNGLVASMEESISEIEARTAPVVKRVLRGAEIGQLEDIEHAQLSMFIALQIMRAPGFRESMRSLDLSMQERLSAAGVDPEKVRLCTPGADPKRAPFYHRMTEQEIAAVALGMMAEQTRAIAAHLLPKNWVVLATNSDNGFYISDCPVVLQNMVNHGPMGNLGIDVKGIEIYLPLSHRICLAMYCPDVFPNVPETDSVGPEHVRNINSLQVMQSSRFVLSARKNFELVEEMLESNPEWQRGPRAQFESLCPTDDQTN